MKMKIYKVQYGLQVVAVVKLVILLRRFDFTIFVSFEFFFTSEQCTKVPKVRLRGHEALSVLYNKFIHSIPNPHY